MERAIESKDRIIEIEQAKECINYIPVDHVDVMPVVAGPDNGTDEEVSNKENETYFGMNVENVWNRGYSGKDINAAVLDVGINTNIGDLSKNINKVLAFNFIDNTTNVTPENFPSYRTDSLRFVDHGNRCASIIAAEKGNGVCGAGIAYEAKVVPLKIISVEHKYHKFKANTISDIIGRALAYGLQHIHVYSNSWSPPEKFEPLDMAIREAILYGVTKGRNKLGAIYVVPDGSDGVSGSGLANNIHTITVNSVGVNGVLPRRPQVSACVLTSGLGEGNRLNTNYMLTSSFNNRCIRSFKGVSAAVAEVSAIIALALQARPLLSVRDIQYLLVESSDQQQLAKTNELKENAAGKLFNPFLGFGLIDADKMVSLSKTWPLVGNIYSSTLRYKNISLKRIDKHQYDSKTERITYEIEFKMEENRCQPHVNTIEHVVLYISHVIVTQRNMILKIISPSNTVSIVVDNGDADSFSKDTTPRNLTSVHFWGENPFGRWKVRIQLAHTTGTYCSQNEYQLELVSLTVYGAFDESKRTWKCVLPTQQTTTTQKNRNSVSQTSTTMKSHERITCWDESVFNLVQLRAVTAMTSPRKE
ncbi:neuroendocrine convertase 2-like [Mercenaria mercenaria]|uniref:neuroendocrine convertase 2-like n=1 Tax=Mercenaria mercenaria TaxID=6596 RepID=UPI00234F44C4|nr:neuroendocrine convertase 2-like [Mercenaria mercenaria]